MQSVFELLLGYWLTDVFIKGTTFPQSLKSTMHNISKIKFVLFLSVNTYHKTWGAIHLANSKVKSTSIFKHLTKI